MKKKFDFVIIVLVYKNYNDLIDLIKSVNNYINNCKIIVVNAFFDKKTEKIIKKCSLENGCDFISIENKGYSYGNNFGLQYAKDNYIFKYAIVSNPDIIIKSKITIDSIGNGDIIAPKIIAKNGKKQNPMQIKNSFIADYFIYKGFKKNNKLFFLLGIIFKKIQRLILMIVYYLLNKRKYKIYSAHGSFVFLSYSMLNIFNFKPYDENVFLFAEESILAYKAAEKKLTTIYNPYISIFHKEDGSMKLSNLSINKELAKANIYYFEKYVKKM